MRFLQKIKNYIGDMKLCQNITSYISGNVSIFCYHKVTKLKKEELLGTPYEDLAVNVKIFENQIKYLVNNFRVIDPYELIDIQKVKSTKEKKVLITFDDGYLDNLENALPILKKYKANAIIFITTNFIGNHESPWWELLWEILQNRDDFIFEGKKIDLLKNRKNKKLYW